MIKIATWSKCTWVCWEREDSETSVHELLQWSPAHRTAQSKCRAI